MTNKEKSLLRQLCKEGYSFEEIKRIVSCAESTIKTYLKQFGDTKND